MAKRQTIRSIISELIKQNYEVEYYDRPDGGVVISKINGQKFSGKKGNQVARSMVGASLSRAQRIQLKDISDIKKGTKRKTRVREALELLPPSTEPKKRGRRRVEPLPKDVERELRKLQKLWRENQGKRKGKPTTKGVRKLLASEGDYWTIAYIKREQQYARGFAYEENVNLLLERIGMLINSVDYDENLQKDLMNVYNAIYNKKSAFKEELIAEIYQDLYDIEKNQEADEDPDLIYDYVNKLKAMVGV